MKQLIKNAYTVFNASLEEYNKQRSEKIELAYVGECQNFYVFAGDWQNLFLINDKGGFEVYLNIDKPNSTNDIEVNSNSIYRAKEIKTFNFGQFIKWLYKRNTLVKQINWTNLDVISHIKKCTSKIKDFESNILIDKKTGKMCGACICNIGYDIEYLVESYSYIDKPHCIIKDGEQTYKFYLPDKKPKSQKEIEITPCFPFKKELAEDEIKKIKHHTMKMISKKSENGNHTLYWELLLMYKAFNPDIEANPIENKGNIFEEDPSYLRIISFCDSIVKKYAKKNNLNPYRILSEMFDKGYIEADSRIRYERKDDFIKDYSYLVDKRN